MIVDTFHWNSNGIELDKDGHEAYWKWTNLLYQCPWWNNVSHCCWQIHGTANVRIGTDGYQVQAVKIGWQEWIVGCMMT